MPTKTPSQSSSRRRGPSKGGRSAAVRKPGSPANPKAKKSTGKPAKSKGSVSAVARARNLVSRIPKPPAPDQLVASVRDEFERLGQRWKNLLPRLKGGGRKGKGKKRARK